MSIKSSVVANLFSQIYLGLISVGMVPLYIRYLGPEAYGLVAFFILIQAWFQMLDMGLSPTLARETARCRGGAVNASEIRQLLRLMELFFWAVAVVGAGLIVAFSGFIATQWLRVGGLPAHDVKTSLCLIGGIVGLRFYSGLYRGAINGFEKIIWLSYFNIFFATARFIAVLIVLPFFENRLITFFVYQLVVAFAELLILFWKTYSLLAGFSLPRGRPRWDWSVLFGRFKFSLSLGFGGLVWVFVTQTDKLILSKLLILQEYGYFSLAVLVASGVMVIGSPVGVVLLPRLTKLYAESDENALILLYRNATQIVASISIPIALVLAFFPRLVLYVWTGDAVIAAKASYILTLYAIGNIFVSLGTFPYYLQFAKGNLKLHVIGNVVYLLVLVPVLVLAVLHIGAPGAGWAWMVLNGISFFCWVPIIHAKMSKGLHLRWITEDIFPGFIIVFVIVAFACIFITPGSGRVAGATFLVILTSVLFFVAILMSSFVRAEIWARLNRTI